ncbi:uncharacterized protein LOC132705596 [Cylas formicarius]|uniref:uncharacterized protein LOC132705596 n=1 Tax=Cylas formicarius TaxID=197179 RepID=UPI00295834B5|nr:uncharacterized protein LOC132705596 [Cylas formicarius]
MDARPLKMRSDILAKRQINEEDITDNDSQSYLSEDQGTNLSNHRSQLVEDSTDISRWRTPEPSTSRAFSPPSSRSQDTHTSQTPLKLQKGTIKKTNKPYWTDVIQQIPLKYLETMWQMNCVTCI